MPQITFITWNSWKFQEAKFVLWDNIELKQVDIDLPEIQTTSVKEVIEAKLKEWCKKLNSPFVVEDTGLEFEAWNSLPWALIKFFIKSVWVEWIIQMLKTFENKKAKVVCYVWYFDWDKTMFFCWEVEWSISSEVLWESWFAFDTIFIPKGESRTFAQMSKEEKNEVSHRKLAFEKLKEYLNKSWF